MIPKLRHILFVATFLVTLFTACDGVNLPPGFGGDTGSLLRWSTAHPDAPRKQRSG